VAHFEADPLYPAVYVFIPTHCHCIYPAASGISVPVQIIIIYSSLLVTVTIYYITSCLYSVSTATAVCCMLYPAVSHPISPRHKNGIWQKIRSRGQEQESAALSPRRKLLRPPRLSCRVAGRGSRGSLRMCLKLFVFVCVFIRLSSYQRLFSDTIPIHNARPRPRLRWLPVSCLSSCACVRGPTPTPSPTADCPSPPPPRPAASQLPALAAAYSSSSRQRRQPPVAVAVA